MCCRDRRGLPALVQCPLNVAAGLGCVVPPAACGSGPLGPGSPAVGEAALGSCCPHCPVHKADCVPECCPSCHAPCGTAVTSPRPQCLRGCCCCALAPARCEHCRRLLAARDSALLHGSSSARAREGRPGSVGASAGDAPVGGAATRGPPGEGGAPGSPALGRCADGTSVARLACGKGARRPGRVLMQPVGILSGVCDCWLHDGCVIGRQRQCTGRA